MNRLVAALICVLMLGFQSAGAQPALSGKPLSQEVYVGATTAGWQGTGIVLDGRTVSISATGVADCDAPNPASTCVTGPDGAPAPFFQGDFLYPEVNWYSLVGMIDGVPFLVGTGPVTVTGSGELFLGYNDNIYEDNSGGYAALVSSCQPGNGNGDTNHCHSGAPGQS